MKNRDERRRKMDEEERDSMSIKESRVVLSQCFFFFSTETLFHCGKEFCVQEGI